MWLKLTKSGNKLFYFHKPTVGYRVHPEAINNVGDQFLFKPSEINNFAIRKKYAHPHLPWIIGASETWKYRVSLRFQSTWMDKEHRLPAMVVFDVDRILQPVLLFRSRQQTNRKKVR